MERVISYPNVRAYIIGLCYFCQTCLHCNKNCNYQTCKCKNKEKTPLNKKGQKRKFYAQTYQPNINKKPFNSSQINELKDINKYYGYGTDFSKEFNYSTYTKCHVKFWRLGKQDVTQNEFRPIQIDLDQFSLLHIDEPDETQVNANQTSSYELEEINSNPSEFNSTLTFTSSDDEDINSTSIEITFKLIIRTTDGKCNTAKWE